MAVPHSITSWIISSVSISNQDGFCVESPNQRLTVYKPFFIQVSMPATIVQFEKTEISATVYNYHNKSLSTIVHFYHVDGLCSDAYRSLDKAHQEVMIRANGSETLIFPIIAIRIGQFRLRIRAKTGNWMDYVEKDLIVLPPGETMEYSHSSYLDPTNRSKRNEPSKRDINEMTEMIDEIYPERQYQKINISFHPGNNDNIVPETIHHRLSLIGRRFEPQLKSPEELSHLIRRRKSCGEQTAFFMAFNLHTLHYLQETGRLNRTLRKRGVRLLKRSLADLISYRKPMDGSFAAFINRESSVWLTAFVANLLCQSEQFLGGEFDANLLSKSLNWIMRQQSISGSWSESTHIHHRHADGGSNSDDDTLTAFILISLHKCDSFMKMNNFSDTIQTNWSIDYAKANREGSQYLLDKISRTDHSYKIAIILYSLLLSPPSLSLPNIDGNQWMKRLLLHPDRHQDGKLNHMYYDTGPLSVETSAYALLALGCLYEGYIEERHMLANWLSARPLYGPVEKTQDTLLTLIALSDYYRSLWFLLSFENENSIYYQLQANISFGHRSSGHRERRSIQFRSDSIDRLHTIDMDGQYVDHIEIETMGNGVGRFELLTIYNVYDPTRVESECHYELNVQLFEYDVYHHHEKKDESDFTDSSFFSDELQESLQIEQLPKSLQHMQFEKMKNICQSKLPPKTIKNDHDGKSGARIKKWQCEQNFQNSPLPTILGPIENPIIKIIRVCTVRRHSDSHVIINDKMAILELSILSGYRVIEEDLATLINGSTTIHWYEVAGSKVTFYLRQVPETYRLCLCFRIYQQNPVEYIQSALVKIYNYGQQGKIISITNILLSL